MTAEADASAAATSSDERLPRPTGSDNAARLARALHFRFRDLGLLRTALTHRSVLHEIASPETGGPDPATVTNERLEFLGDAVLGAVAAEYLYNLDPLADEGELTRRRVALVRAETLVRWAREIDLGSYLYLGPGERPGSSSRDRMLAGGFEAVIGAVALDRGFGAARSSCCGCSSAMRRRSWRGRRARRIQKGGCRNSFRSTIGWRRNMTPFPRRSGPRPHLHRRGAVQGTQTRPGCGPHQARGAAVGCG